MMTVPPLALIFLFQTPPSPVLEQGRALTASFYKGEMDALWARFSPEMKKGIGSVENLRGFRTQVEGQAGVEESVADEKVDSKDGFRIYQRIARFSKAPMRIMVQWTLGPDDSVAGFFIRPVPEAPAREQLEYATKTELRLPFAGPWFVFWGGRTLEQNYHFATVDQRFAYDIVVQRNGRSHAGEGKRNEDYYCFDQKIVAPAAGVVVSVENGVADNVPGVMNAQVPMGNHVILDHGNGEFSFLCHLRQGTVAVKKGDQVKVGDLLGRAGNSGNSSEPHLHFHLQDTGEFAKGRGLPAPFKGYRADGKLVDRGEPVKGQTIVNK
jgi:murein DD-endopeptidase MepM/ murein hydrolase activator NlpD